MGLANRIIALWQTLHADSFDGERARRRARASAAMAAFLLALLAVVGFLQILLLVLALVAVGAGIGAVALLARRYRESVVTRTRAATNRAVALKPVVSAAAVRTGAQVGRAAATAQSGTRRTLDATIPELRGRLGRAHDAVARQLTATAEQAHRRLDAAAARIDTQGSGWPERPPIDRHREAMRANAAGSQLRRDGAYGEAAERHRLALELFRELGDRRGEALTLNNLALALDRAGDASALELFEEAATILGELGEDQREGEVIANLALAFRRRGQEDQSAEVFEIALGKLNPDSQAYRKVEELRRAS